MQIILGSSSIARRKILSEMGYEFTLMVIFIYLGNLSVTNLLEKRSFSSIVYVECRYWWEEYQKGEAGRFGHGSCWCKGSVFYLIVKSLFDMIVLIDRKILESQSNQCYISSICPCGCGCVNCLVLCFRMSNRIMKLSSYFYWFECDWHLRLIPLYQSYKISIIKRKMRYQLFWLLLIQYVLTLFSYCAPLLGSQSLFHQMPSMIWGYIFEWSK